MHRVCGGASILALALAACVVDPVDFTGKTCAEGDCPAGLRCDAKSKTCVALASGDAGFGRDASVPGPDAGLDAGGEGEDAGEADAGATSCTGDPECRDLGALYCDLMSATCQPCDIDDHCGASCNKCPSGQMCIASECATCATAQHCGSKCLPCPTALPFCGAAHTCVECQADSDCHDAAEPVCGPAGACVECVKDDTCGAGKWCSGSSCVACDVDLHCGPSCLVCAAPTPACVSGVCRACAKDADCGAAGSCCHNDCFTAGPPRLQRVNPPYAPYGLPNPTLVLSGENFGPCAQVMVAGAQVSAVVSSTTQATATLNGMMPRGTYPVQVVNPGPGGGASNPNATLIGSVGLGGMPIDVEFLAPDTLAVLETAYRVELYGATSLSNLNRPINLAASRTPTSMRGTASKLWVTLDTAATPGQLIVVANPLTTPGQSTLTIGANGQAGKDIDFDEALGLVVVALNGTGYRMLDIATNAMGPVNVLNPYNGGLTGIGLDPRYGSLVFAGNTQMSVVPLGATAPAFTYSEPSTGAVVDRVSNRAYVGTASALRVIDLATDTQLFPSISVARALHWMRVNPVSQLLVGVPSGVLASGENNAYDVGIVEPAGSTLVTYLGTGGGRGCGPTVDAWNTAHEGIAVDPTHNRAFVTQSCTQRLQSYNLNLVVVR